jgi:TolB protein
LIGFNFVPYQIIDQNSECPTQYLTYEDSAGFWIVNDKAQNLKRILPYRLITPSWSPDGKWIAFSYDAQIFIMPFDGEQFDTTSIIQLTSEGRNFFPSWSPDGEMIAYDSDKDSPTGLKFIWKMRKNGLSKRRIAYTPDLGETRMPFWGSDNSILHKRFSANGDPDIYKMDSSGNNVIRITHNSLRESDPAYSSDCKSIFFTMESMKTKRIELWQQNIGSSEPVQLTEGGCIRFSISKSGKIVYMYHDEADIGNIWIMNPDGNIQPLIK